MKPELYNRIFAELLPTAEIVDLRGWGESAILPNFLSIAQTVIDSGATVRLVTNLSYQRKGLLEFLYSSGAWLDLSIDTLDEKTLSLVRPGANLKHIRSNLKLLSALPPPSVGGRIRVLTVIQQPSLQTLYTTFTELSDFGVKEIVLTPIRTHSRSQLSLANNQRELQDFLKWAFEFAEQNGITVTLGRVVSQSDEPARPKPCIHPWTHAYFRFDGGVGYCDHLIGPTFDNEILGHLENGDSFDEIWNGNQWQQLRATHASKATSDRCYRNCHDCYLNRPIDYEKLLLNSL